MEGVLPAEGSAPPPFLLVDGRIVASEEVVVQLYFDDLEEGDVAFPLLLIAEFENKPLVAVPFAAWHRNVSRRQMQPGALSKPAVVVEVLAADAVDKMILKPDYHIKCWVGYLQPALLTHLQPLTDYEDCSFTFGVVEGTYAIPAIESLVTAANEHFAFFSAGDGLSGAEDAIDPGLMPGDGGSGSADLGARVDAIEVTLRTLSEGMNQLLMKIPGGEQTTAPRQPALRKTAPPKEVKPKNAQPKLHFPHLDAGVVEAALQAGIPTHSLAMMEKLVTQNVKAKRVVDERPSVALGDPLSEEEEDAGEGRLAAEEESESGGVPADPMAATLSKLTSIVSFLAEDKKKARGASKLDLALDSAQGSSASDGFSVRAVKKTAAARRALRTALTDHPEEIHACIERLMYEDLSSQTLGPGQPPWGSMPVHGWNTARESMATRLGRIAHGPLQESSMLWSVARQPWRELALAWPWYSWIKQL